MALTESAKKRQFGNVEPQQLRDYSGTNSSLLYEGYATPGVATSTAGWAIIKHTIDASGFDTASQPKFGLIWDLRTIYSYGSP